MTLGQKLRQTRLSKGLSQSQVAGGCVTRNMLSQIENDQASPSMRTLEHLARALDVSVGWLLSDEQTDAALENAPGAHAVPGRRLCRMPGAFCAGCAVRR